MKCVPWLKNSNLSHWHHLCSQLFAPNVILYFPVLNQVNTSWGSIPSRSSLVFHNSCQFFQAASFVPRWAGRKGKLSIRFKEFEGLISQDRLPAECTVSSVQLVGVSKLLPFYLFRIKQESFPFHSLQTSLLQSLTLEAVVLFSGPETLSVGRF